MLNIFVALFVLLMIYWWSEQGLFSAFLHLLITLLSGLIALAVWEPIAMNWLLDRMPDHAWGVALLLPFVTSMFLLRYLTDKFVPNNVLFPHLFDRIGGGVVGLGSGTLTGGVLIIALQMTGMPEFFEYRPWTLGETQEPERADTLWVPVDRITADVFSRLTEGSMAPVFADAPTSHYYRDLSLEASLYNHASFPDSRRALRPANLQLMEEEPLYLLETLPSRLAEHGDLVLNADQRIAVVGTEIILQAEEGQGGADGDGSFRATPHQVTLTYENSDGTGGFAHPLGIIQRGDFGALTVAGIYATGLGDRVAYHWVFRLPADAEPRFIRVKNARVAVPDETVEEVAAVQALLGYDRPAVADQAAAENTQDLSDVATVSDSLPITVDRGILERRNVEVEGDTLYAGAANITDGGRPGQNLSVNKIHHAENARIVQVNLGRNEPTTLLGRVIRTATAATQAPILTDQHGTRYFPIGYIATSGRALRFSIDPTRTVRSLSELNIGSVGEEERLLIIFQVEAGVTITSLDLGDRTERLNLQVPRND